MNIEHIWCYDNFWSQYTTVFCNVLGALLNRSFKIKDTLLIVPNLIQTSKIPCKNPASSLVWIKCHNTDQRSIKVQRFFFCWGTDTDVEEKFQHKTETSSSEKTSWCWSLLNCFFQNYIRIVSGFWVCMRCSELDTVCLQVQNNSTKRFS